MRLIYPKCLNAVINGAHALLRVTLCTSPAWSITVDEKALLASAASLQLTAKLFPSGINRGTICIYI